MDPDQTAPSGCEASNILVDNKSIHFVIMRCKG